MGSPSYSSACRIVATTMEECSVLPSVLVVYSLVALPCCNNPCGGTELHLSLPSALQLNATSCERASPAAVSVPRLIK